MEDTDVVSSSLPSWAKGEHDSSLGSDAAEERQRSPEQWLDLIQQLLVAGGYFRARVASTLDDSAPLVIYGCMSGRAPSWPWNQWVFKQMQVNGFNLRTWMKNNKKKIPQMMEALAKLVNADKLRVTYTEYELGTEFDEALDHALEEGRSTKILLKVKDIGVTY